MTCTNLSPFGPFPGVRSQRVAGGSGGDAVYGSLGCQRGEGLAPCPSTSKGLVEGNPPQLRLLPGTSWEGASRWESAWAPGHCVCPGAQRAPQLSQPGGRRKPYPPQVPCSRHGVSCLNLVLAPRKPPRFSLREGPPKPLLAWGRGRRWPGAGGVRAGQRALGCPPVALPEVLTARPCCRHLCWHKSRCQCLFFSLMEM